MAEENNQTENNAEAQQAAQPVFQLARCYLKDASLEMPHAPQIFVEQLNEQPKVDVQFEVSQAKLADSVYEVVVRGTITVTAAEKTMFLVEGKQAGIFEIGNFPEEAVQTITNVNCPTIVYPYLRANLADLVTRTGMPPVNLPEVNFEGLYAQRLAQQQEQTAGQDATAHA